MSLEGKFALHLLPTWEAQLLFQAQFSDTELSSADVLLQEDR